jgi:hypothetical protein
MGTRLRAFFATNKPKAYPGGDTVKTVLISISAAALTVGIAVAQGAVPSSSSASGPQTPASPANPASAQAPSARAPQAGSTSAPGGAPTRIAPGSVIPVSLTKTIDAKKVKTGDQVVAKVTQDMKTNSGEVLVPKDTKVMGHVTEAQPRNKDQKESQVGIAFDRAMMKDGSAMQIPMSIQAIIGQQNDQNNSGSGSGEAAAPTGGASSGATGSPRGGMGGSAPASAPSASSGTPGDAPAGKSSRPPITAQTEGVVGISDLKLSRAASSAAEGSVVSSEKNNVKLESGTMMLLRVGQ